MDPSFVAGGSTSFGGGVSQLGSSYETKLKRLARHTPLTPARSAPWRPGLHVFLRVHGRTMRQPQAAERADSAICKQDWSSRVSIRSLQSLSRSNRQFTDINIRSPVGNHPRLSCSGRAKRPQRTTPLSTAVDVRRRATHERSYGHSDLPRATRLLRSP